jgi:hypothetical protein
MNEHIKLLKEQAMEWVPNMADPDTKIRLLNAEKFALLIVKECAEIARSNTRVDSKLYLMIQEHFGVEE